MERNPSTPICWNGSNDHKKLPDERQGRDIEPISATGKMHNPCALLNAALWNERLNVHVVRWFVYS
jgi:hypothetical protein